MEKLIQIAALSVGGVLGVNARYWFGLWVNRYASSQFPWATFTINVSGSFLIGFLTLVLVRWLPHQNTRLLVITGFLGGYTTFSTFAYESITLWQRGEKGISVGYMAGSVLAGFIAAALGIAFAEFLTIPKTAEAKVSGAKLEAVAEREKVVASDARGDAMIPEDASFLRLYVNADDRLEGMALYEAVVTKARAMGLAGASVFKSEMGFGLHHRIHDEKSEYTFAGLPLVVEVVDSQVRLEALLSELKTMVGEGLVTVSTVSPVRVEHYVHPSE